MLPVANPGELVQIAMQDPGSAERPYNIFTHPLWEQVFDQQDVFSNVFAWSREDFDLARGGAIKNADGLWVSGDFFDGLGLRSAAGRLIMPSDDRPGCTAVAVLSYGFWQDHYAGATSAIGASLSLNNHPFEVIGVAPRGFYGLEVGRKFDVAAPICATTIIDPSNSRLIQRSWWWLNVAGRIKSGIGGTQVSARLRTLSPSIFTAALPQDWSADGQREFMKRILVTAPAATGISGLRRQFDHPLQILMGLVGLVLVIASANIASLMLARAAARHKEIAVRRALGASRLRLVRQLLTECILLSSAGAMVGILFARWGTSLLVRVISTTRNAVSLDVSLDGRVLAFTAAVSGFAGILFGLLPAIQSTRVSLTSAMKGSQALEVKGLARFHARTLIVASQVALSLVVLVAAALLLRSFVKLATLDIGFDSNDVLLVDTHVRVAKVPPEQQLATYDLIEDRLSGLPGVISVGRSAISPISGQGWNGWIVTDWSKVLTRHNALAWFNCVSPGYVPTLRMQLVAGRNFISGDTKNSPKVAIVNQTLARRFFPNLNPVGRTFRINDIKGNPGPPIEVVGLVNDAKYESVREEIRPTAFFPATQIPAGFQDETLELRTAIRPSALSAEVQAAIESVNNQIPLGFHTLAEQVSDTMVRERSLALLSGFFGALALLMAMVGLYGSVSFMVTRRQAEFGIRMALGAERGAILRLVMRDVAAILTAGIVAGALISLATTRVLAKLLFGLGARDPVTLAGAIGVLSLVAFIATLIPARRATKVDPMVALRHE
jgi:predicted permease